MLASKISPSDANLDKIIYFATSFALAIIIFFYLPSNLYHSDPAFFGRNFVPVLINFSPYIIGYIACVIFLWFILKNLLIHRIFSYIFLFLFISALINIYVITRDYGNLDAGFFILGSKLETNFLWFRDFFASFLLAFILLFLCTRQRVKKELPKLVGIIILPMLFTTIYNINFIKAVDVLDVTENKELIQEMQNYSKKQENVVIITMDMFTGGHIAKMIDDPWFDDFSTSMDGFTWFPDTMATGSATIFSLPSMYGGQGYTPKMINEFGISREEAFNKAVSVLPRNFSKHGYVTHFVKGFYFLNMDYLKKNNGLNENTHYIEDIKFPANPDLFQVHSSSLENDNIHLFTLALSLFNIAPHLLKTVIYDGGKWLNTQTIVIVHGTSNVAEKANTFYNLLTMNIDNTSKKPTFKMLYTALSHFPWHLHKETLGLLVTDPYPATPENNTLVDQIIPEHYYTERHMMKLLVDYFNHLKKLGVYDNTKIILVSDHDARDSQMLDDMLGAFSMKDKTLKKGSVDHLSLRLGRPHALLMVKDFNSRGNLKVDNALMSNADVPALAALHLASFDEFPLIDPRKKSQNTIREHDIGNWRWEKHEKNKYIINERWQITGSMFELDNWKEISVD